MKRIVAYCGIICSDCPTYKATQTNDDAERKRIAELWTKQYGEEYMAQDINCDSCLTRGNKIFKYCKICEIRKCAGERNVKNCAYCQDYACERLSRLQNEYKPAKEVLDEIRASTNLKF
jgi:hypothetical protein